MRPAARHLAAALVLAAGAAHASGPGGIGEITWLPSSGTLEIELWSGCLSSSLSGRWEAEATAREGAIHLSGRARFGEGERTRIVTADCMGAHHARATVPGLAPGEWALVVNGVEVRRLLLTDAVAAWDRSGEPLGLFGPYPPGGLFGQPGPGG